MSASVSKAMNAFSAEVIRACALKYGFDGEEAMRELSVSIAEGKKTKAKKEQAAPKTANRVQPSIPLPFTGVVRDDCCLGVKQNHGLYTQCFSAPGESGLCKGCSKQASKNASGEPDCGLIAKRVMQGSEYRDAKGRAPVHYTKVMKKQKLTEEQVQVEAAKFGIEIEASHFAIPETKRGRPKKATTSDTESENSSAAGGEKKARGRPKKAAKVVEVNATEDLFASLMQQAQSASPRPSANLAAGGGAALAQQEEMSDVSSESGSESDSESKSSKKKTKKSKEPSEEELADKAAKFLAKEAEKEKKAAAKAAEKEAEKVKKAAEKEAEKVKKAAEKEAEKAKKLAEKAAKEEKPKKEKKASKKKAEEPVKPVEPVADLESESESEDEEPVVAVKKFEHQGVTYLKSGDGVLYDAKTQSVVGKWNETSKSIEVYNDESEEESDSDDE